MQIWHLISSFLVEYKSFIIFQLHSSQIDLDRLSSPLVKGSFIVFVKVFEKNPTFRVEKIIKIFQLISG